MTDTSQGGEAARQAVVRTEPYMSANERTQRAVILASRSCHEQQHRRHPRNEGEILMLIFSMQGS